MNRSDWLATALKIFQADFTSSPLCIVDVGAAGAPPPNMATLAPVSTYLGFDPDLRSPQEGNAFGFVNHQMLATAVTASNQSQVVFISYPISGMLQYAETQSDGNEPLFDWRIFQCRGSTIGSSHQSFRRIESSQTRSYRLVEAGYSGH